MFTVVFGELFSTFRVEKWEQRERQPEGPTRTYLFVIANNPKAVINALAVKKA